MKKLIICSILAICAVVISCGNNAQSDNNDTSADSTAVMMPEAVDSNVVTTDGYQIFSEAGFKIKCPAKLEINYHLIASARNAGSDPLAYIGVTDKEDPDKGCIYNINITDCNESDEYRQANKSVRKKFEQGTLDAYAAKLKEDGIKYDYVTFCGERALLYSFEPMELPTKAVFFYRDGHGYLLQVATRQDLGNKFKSFMQSFEFL